MSLFPFYLIQSRGQLLYVADSADFDYPICHYLGFLGSSTLILDLLSQQQVRKPKPAREQVYLT